MSKYPTTRNFGFGKHMEWAGRKTLEQYYGNGHFATVSTHAQHWSLFCRWIQATRDIRDARDVTQQHLEEYADMLCKCVMDETLDVAYAQNLISSVNVVLEAMRGPLPIRIESPSDWVGRRVTYRSEPPTGQDWSQVVAAADHLAKQGMPRAQVVVLLCRYFGVRLREAVLANISDWIKQARERGEIDVREGTKGGRGNEIARWVPCDRKGQYLLAEAERICRGLGCGENMLLPGETYVSFVNNGEINRARLPLHKLGIKGYHELRAAYACQRYEDLSGYLAPVFLSDNCAGYRIHWKTIDTITMELGHERRDVVEEYIGDYSAHRSLLQNRKYEARQALRAAKKVSIALLLRRAMPGSRASISAHIERGERIADAIQERFGIGDPHQWQAKHVRWVLDRWGQSLSINTRYDYWRTARALASVLGHWPDWAPHLQGPWCKPGKGGRPAKLARPRNAT